MPRSTTRRPPARPVPQAERLPPVTVPPALPVEPGGSAARLLVSVREARAMLGIGHTKACELLARGELRAKKLGGRTLVERRSVLELFERLPRAGSSA